MDPIYSNLAADEESRELLVFFIDESLEKIARLQQNLAARNWTELQRVAHQLKGSAGSFGFDEISRAALELETAVMLKQPEEQITAATQQLVDLCQRATSEERPEHRKI